MPSPETPAPERDDRPPYRRGIRLPAGAGILRSLLGTALGVTVVLGLLMTATCWSYARKSRPAPAWQEDAFVLSGEFRPDGSCAVLLDGEPVAAVDTPRTEFEHDMATGVAPDAFDVDQVNCEIAQPYVQGVPSDHRTFWVWGAVPRGRVLKPGRYRIDGEALAAGDTSAMEAALFHPRFDDERAYLVGYRGYVRITQVDSPTVVGTFHIVARRERRSPFS